jgi:hypothetical protein
MVPGSRQASKESLDFIDGASDIRGHSIGNSGTVPRQIEERIRGALNRDVRSAEYTQRHRLNSCLRQMKVEHERINLDFIRRVNYEQQKFLNQMPHPALEQSSNGR